MRSWENGAPDCSSCSKSEEGDRASERGTQGSAPIAQRNSREKKVVFFSPPAPLSLEFVNSMSEFIHTDGQGTETQEESLGRVVYHEVSLVFFWDKNGTRSRLNIDIDYRD